MAAINSPNCSALSGLVLLLATSIERGGIGLRGTPVSAWRLGSAAHRYKELMANPAVEGSRLHQPVLNLFPQLGHPVIHERRIQLPQMQMRVVPITPTDEMPQLPAVAFLGLFRARAGALLQESLQEELVPPGAGITNASASLP